MDGQELRVPHVFVGRGPGTVDARSLRPLLSFHSAQKMADGGIRMEGQQITSIEVVSGFCPMLSQKSEVYRFLSEIHRLTIFVKKIRGVSFFVQKS